MAVRRLISGPQELPDVDSESGGAIDRRPPHQLDVTISGRRRWRDHLDHEVLYYQQGASDKHLRDIASMLRISPEQINLERIRSLAADHELGALLDRVLEAAADD